VRVSQLTKLTQWHSPTGTPTGIRGSSINELHARGSASSGIRWWAGRDHVVSVPARHY